MGRNYSPEVEYTCLNDCEQAGCQGHKLRFVSCRSSDVLSVEIDGKTEYYFDANAFKAILEAYQKL